ncbi:hypothetical protein OAP82_10500 [Paracoccaceae bacterium]|nr:hypothetical protein [Paracoccaceae bacterium]
MSDAITIDGQKYSSQELSDSGKILSQHLIFSAEMIRQLNAETALLLKAKNGYIADLKMEITEQKSGVDFNMLFRED